jgi:hypothetical protein
MVGGFNTNVRRGGRVFHVQTEDSGVRSPKIVTLLYEGGTILTSRKRTYEDSLGEEGLEQIVRELMEEQHRAMLEALRAGELDAMIGLERKTRTSGRGAGAGRARERELEFGAAVVSGRTLDAVVLERLCAS